ncbi:hypothetical protein [Methylobacter sp.]|uniref:hypothetical protein n=1 Tax=Methylobacter sp. TaxID=2051955 RepID=UPI003DA4A869
MREVIQCLIDWLDSVPSDERAHRILRALAEESLTKADLEEKIRRFTNKDIVAATGVITDEPPNKWVDWNKTVLPYWNTRKESIIKFARKRKLNSYPDLGYFIPPKGGRGNESRYELWSNLVYGESSGILLLISGLFNAVDEFDAGDNFRQALITS